MFLGAEFRVVVSGQVSGFWADENKDTNKTRFNPIGLCKLNYENGR